MHSVTARPEAIENCSHCSLVQQIWLLRCAGHSYVGHDSGHLRPLSDHCQVITVGCSSVD